MTDIFLSKYSNSFVVFGNTLPHTKLFKSIGGIFNPQLDGIWTNQVIKFYPIPPQFQGTTFILPISQLPILVDHFPNIQQTE